MQARVIAIVYTVAFAACSPRYDAALLSAPIRSASEVLAATDVGANVQQFSDLVIKFSSEMDLVKGKAQTPQEKEVLQHLDDGLTAYKDSLRAWRAKIAQESYSDSPTLNELGLTYQATPNRYGRFDADEVLQLAWMVGRDHISLARTKHGALSK